MNMISTFAKHLPGSFSPGYQGRCFQRCQTHFLALSMRNSPQPIFSVPMPRTSQGSNQSAITVASILASATQATTSLWTNAQSATSPATMDTISHGNPHPQCQFLYIPLIPQLLAFLKSAHMADLMQYRSKHVHVPGVYDDIFDGECYQQLRSAPITVHNEPVDPPASYFKDNRDIALGLSTNSFGIFTHGQATACISKHDNCFFPQLYDIILT